MPRRTLAQARDVTRIFTLAAATLAAGAAVSARPPATDPLALLAPAGTITAEDRVRLEAGSAVVDVLPARQRDLAVFGAARTRAANDRLIAWMREIEELHRGKYIPLIRRFSDQPRADDVASLTLDEEDLSDLATCEPGSCGVKLSGAEIQRVRQAAADAGPRWKGAVQAVFRDIVLARACGYLARGDAAAGPYEDKRKPVHPSAEFNSLTAQLAGDGLLGAAATEYLRFYPHRLDAEVESFLYWSKETLGDSKPIVTITHVSIFRSDDPGRPPVLVAAKQVFATHYLTASLSLTALTRPAADGRRYLLYLRRSRADVLGGTFGAMVRRIIERRVRAEAPGVLDALRRRLENGAPSALSSR